MLYKITNSLGWVVYKKEFMPKGVDWLWDVHRVYQANKIKVPETFLDVGANEGQTALKISNYFPSAKVYSFEPVQQIYQILQEKTKKSFNIYPQHLAVSNYSGDVEMLYNKSFGMKSRLQEQSASPNDLKNEKFEKQTVKAITLDQFLSDNNISKVCVLKTDTEGHDLSVLKGAEKSLRDGMIDFLYVECSFNRDHQHITKYQDVSQWLENLDFTPYGFYEYWYRDDQSILFLNVLFVKRGNLVHVE
jgi:FkbM family methyltransferase